MGLGSIILSGILYGSLGLFGTLILKTGMSVSALLFWRFAISTVLLLGIHRKGWQELKSVWNQRRGILITLLSALLYLISSALYFVGTTRIGTGLAMVIFYCYPVFVFLWLWLVEKQIIHLSSWVSLAVVSFGFLILNQSHSLSHWDWVGVFASVISAAMYAAYIFIGKKSAQQHSPWLSTGVLCFVSSIYSLFYALLEGTLSVPIGIYSWGVLFALSILATIVPIFLMLEGLKTVKADLASILTVLEPIVTIILGVLFLNETLSPDQILGIIVILCGTIASTWSLSQPTVSSRIETATSP